MIFIKAAYLSLLFFPAIAVHSASHFDSFHKYIEKGMDVDPKAVLHLPAGATEKEKHKAMKEYLLLKEIQKKRRNSVDGNTGTTAKPQLSNAGRKGSVG